MNNSYNTIAYKLWIYYYYKTEEFDSKLPTATPDLFDKSSVRVFGADVSKSNNNATKVRKLIYEVAKYYDVESDMFSAKKMVGRMNQLLINLEFNTLNSMGYFDFINQYIEDMEEY